MIKENSSFTLECYDVANQTVQGTCHKAQPKTEKEEAWTLEPLAWANPHLFCLELGASVSSSVTCVLASQDSREN